MEGFLGGLEGHMIALPPLVQVLLAILELAADVLITDAGIKSSECVQVVSEDCLGKLAIM